MDVQNNPLLNQPAEIFNIIESNLDRNDQIAVASTCSFLRERGVATGIIPATVDLTRAINKYFNNGYRQGYDRAPQDARNVTKVASYITLTPLLLPATVTLAATCNLLYDGKLDIARVSRLDVVGVSIFTGFTVSGIGLYISATRVFPEWAHDLGGHAIARNVAGKFFGSLQMARGAVAWGWDFGLPVAREALDMAYGNDNSNYS